MKLSLSIAREIWPIAGTFTIARGSKSNAEVVVVTLRRDGTIGMGECVPYPRYGETVETALGALEAVRGELEAGFDRAQIPLLIKPMAARNALDCALWDLEAKSSGRTIWQILGLPEPKQMVTAYTISLDTAEAMAAAASGVRHRPLLKLKLGHGEGDIARLKAVRQAAPAARLIVDANEGWKPSELERLLHECALAGVELVEQPLPAANDNALLTVRRPIPVCADESVHDSESLGALLGKYDAINVKLDKTGGLTEALTLCQAASNHGLKIMAGCMVATSLSMAPAMVIAQKAAVVDLDGPLLLKQDRIPGIRYEDGFIYPPPRTLWG